MRRGGGEREENSKAIRKTRTEPTFFVGVFNRNNAAFLKREMIAIERSRSNSKSSKR